MGSSLSTKSGGWAALVRWLGLQIAGKAVALALGAPIVTGAAMGILAYIQGLPLAYGFLAVLLSMASVSVLFNQARVFMLAYTANNKMVPEAAVVFRATDDHGNEGYAVGVTIRNKADVPLEFRETRSAAELDGRVLKQDVVSTKGDIVESGECRIHVVGFVKMVPVTTGALAGKCDLVFDYGRPGNLIYQRSFKRSLRAALAPDGSVVHTNAVVTD